ncbi:hypothetical protein CAPTEDRAFT_221555 [Capitella teleta]|uniref:Amino acid transporter transmembrane domain-containing protein n=1 Tax=Capitella teleta TaxID=283909 RepID=R7U805_CAPTE|nr:hypothetical protein CAPTEDRAFT_221555 [Capitella teleta]|eukprot:ELT99255.1 hypothetical protein CAPTEDRAFT_221555 [Capitella teleta]
MSFHDFSVKAMLLLVDCKHMLTEKHLKHAVGNGRARSLSGLELIPEETQELIEMEVNGVPVVKVNHESSKPVAAGHGGHHELNYGDVGFHAVGWIGRFLVDVTIIISQIGFCCAYLIFISENLSDYIAGMHLIHWLAILLPPLFLLTLLRTLNSLAVSSLFAQLSNIMAFAVVFWFDFEHFSKIERIHPKKISIKGFPFFLAIAIYCYEGAGMILSLESSLHFDIRHKFKFYFKSTLVLVTSLYISFGLCGYLSFGPDTNQIITLNLPKGTSLDFAIVVKSCLCLALFFTYPIMMFPVIKLLEVKVLPRPESVWQGNMLRLCMVMLTGIIVLGIPNFSTLMALVGATCCTLLAFTLPGIFHLQLTKQITGSISRWAFSIDVFLIVLGIVGALIGTLDALMRLQIDDKEPPNFAKSSVNDTVLSLLSKASSNQSSNGTATVS